MQLKNIFINIFILIIIDQYSKFLAITYLNHNNRITVISGLLDLILWKNTGAAFGFLTNLPGKRWILITLTLITLVIIIIYLVIYQVKITRSIVLCISLIYGGAIGNLIDRIYTGEVTDFILIYYKEWSWPIFNIADLNITLGIVWLAIISYISPSP